MVNTSFEPGKQYFFDLSQTEEGRNKCKETLSFVFQKEESWVQKGSSIDSDIQTFIGMLCERHHLEDAKTYLLGKVSKEREGGEKETCDKLNAFFLKVIDGTLGGSVISPDDAIDESSEFSVDDSESSEYDGRSSFSESESSDCYSHDAVMTDSTRSSETDESIQTPPEHFVPLNRDLPFARSNDYGRLTVSCAQADIPRYVEESIRGSEIQSESEKKSRQSLLSRFLSIVRQWCSRLIEWLGKLFS